VTVYEQIGEIKCLKEEIQRFNVENGTILVNVVDGNDGITKTKTSFEAGTCSNNEAAITNILMKLEADDESKVKFSHFTGLHGEYIVVGKYSLEPTLLTIVNNIIKVY
ncbi:hypothetical protein Gohar_024814, partial [Gossypium harknessii]|nr:hypothetical protein [Gossypium harknessii]